MKNKFLSFLLHTLLPISFWLLLWEVAALIYDNSYFLPDICETALALCGIIISPDFPKIVLSTLLRILAGILLGTLSGALMAILSHKVKLVYSLISPFNSVIKATPVASIIILLWISMSGNALAIFVAFLIVFPIIFQNLYDAFESIDNQLIEASIIFEFSYKKRLKFLVLPALKQYFVPAFITAIGLAFKAEIAAEIIAGIRNSIGQMIYYAKDEPAIDKMFAWTIIGVVLSILVEKLVKRVLSYKKASKRRAEI